MKRLDVRIIGPVFDVSGISSHTREFSLALSEAGIVVHLVNITNISPYKAKLDTATQKRIEILMNTQISDNYVTIHMVPAEFMRLYDEKSKANICWTGYETDRLPYVAALMLNDPRLKEIWVPTQTCLNIFNGCGVDKNKTKLIPWGVDTTLFQPGNAGAADLKEEGSFYFSFISSLKPSAGFDIVLRAFYEEFKSEPNVKLLFKAFMGNIESDKEGELIKQVVGRIKGDSKAEVVYVPGNMDTESLRSLYHTGDCLISVPRAKIWNNSVIRSMAAGVPVITNINTGNRSYTNHQNAILVGSSLRKIIDVDFLINNPLQQEHSWFESDLNELKISMRKVYNKEIDVEKLKIEARRTSLKYDWKRICIDVIKNIKKYGE